MLYRTLGRTGLKVSQLGFGAMRLPMTGEGQSALVDRGRAIPLIRRAFELGVNYIDTATFYGNQDSQQAVGEALAGWRDRIVVSTKNPYYGPDEHEWWQHLENSLQRLNVGYIDIYHHHGINWKCFVEDVEPRVSRWMQKAKERGLIKHICTSFHDDNAALLRILERDYIDVVTLQYNLLDRQLERAIAEAGRRNIGVVVMGPVAGGRLGVDSEVLGQVLPHVRHVPELALRFVLANPNVSVALSGMSDLRQLEENVATANDPVPLREEDFTAIDEHLRKLRQMADLYCTGCNYCKPCESGVEISTIFGIYNLGRVYGLWEVARQRYAHLVQQSKGADRCAQCHECESRCPQHLNICRQLEEAHTALTSRC